MRNTGTRAFKKLTFIPRTLARGPGILTCSYASDPSFPPQPALRLLPSCATRYIEARVVGGAGMSYFANCHLPEYLFPFLVRPGGA
eukprot:scaffold100119_cov22-Tisochrysis_lutea.AAC.1